MSRDAKIAVFAVFALLTSAYFGIVYTGVGTISIGILGGTPIAKRALLRGIFYAVGDIFQNVYGNKSFAFWGAITTCVAWWLSSHQDWKLLLVMGAGLAIDIALQAIMSGGGWFTRIAEAGVSDVVSMTAETAVYILFCTEVSVLTASAFFYPVLKAAVVGLLAGLIGGVVSIILHKK